MKIGQSVLSLFSVFQMKDQAPLGIIDQIILAQRIILIHLKTVFKYWEKVIQVVVAFNWVILFHSVVLLIIFRERLIHFLFILWISETFVSDWQSVHQYPVISFKLI